jgi:glycosyltransferase involved in cell wall biosynthesis
MLEKVFRAAPSFDIIHFHVDYLHFPSSRRFVSPNVTTLHGRLDIPGLQHLYREFSEMPLVSISDAQRRPIPWANWQGTVHHGLPPDLLRPGDGSGGYLAFLGRISPEKGIDRAIEIAQRVGTPLRVAAKIDEADKSYFETHIRKLFDCPLVEYMGEINETNKAEFLGNAKALLFPIDWPEPFGLVMIEALSCGTPVVAFRGGSVQEVIDDGATGFVVENADEAVQVLAGLDSISRSKCRKVFESRFSVNRMVDDYIRIYTRLSKSASMEDLESVPQ